MALSANQYLGDGINKDFTLDFTLGYLRESHIHVFVDGVEIPQNTLTFILGGGAIRTPNPPADGSIVLVRRITPTGSLIHDYTDGALIIEKHLDESNLQPIMLMHEALDGFADAGKAANLDMGNNRIVNLAPAVDATDATTLQQVTDLIVANSGEGVVPQLQPRQIGDNVTTQFAAPHTGAALSTSFFVQWDGITQRPLTDFTSAVVGFIDFTTPPPLGTLIDITYFEPNTLEEDIFLSAPPITGTYDIPDKVWNSAPVSGQPVGWVCTVAGTPGTWVGFGVLL